MCGGFVKHEQKGEQMKSIELSDGEIMHVKGLLNKHIGLFNSSSHKPNVTIGILYKLENAKPIPTEPRWSEEEILEIHDKIIPTMPTDHQGACSEFSYDVIRHLKTPKPRLRDRNEDEKIKWWATFDKPSEMFFTSDPHNPHLDDVTTPNNDMTHYQITSTSPWLPIPQIEIESEK